MTTRIVTILLILNFLSASAQKKASEVSAKIDEYLVALTKINNFNGNLLVAKDGRMLLNKSYNMASGTDSTKVTENSRFLISSVSKLFVKFALVKLEESGKIKLSDPVSKYIRGIPSGDKITLKHLMDHRSGLPRELSIYNPDSEIPMDTVVQLAREEKLLFKPGTEIRYSNIGYYLLQYIIHVKTGNYSAFIETEIFKKMGMTNTGELSRTTPAINMTYGFGPGNGKPKRAAFSLMREIYNAEYYSTVNDLFVFSQQITDGKTLTKEASKKLFWKDSILIQSGGREGYRSFFSRNDKTGITFIFLCNYTDIPFQDICEDVINIIEGNPYRVRTNEARVAKDLPEETLKKYVGTYMLEVDHNQFFEITLENGKLVFSDGVERITLMAETETTFFENPQSSDSFKFSENEKTKKSDLVLTTGGVRFKAVRKD